MPYSKKEDRTEAVRRHRRKKADEQLQVERAEEFDASLAGFLKTMGFQEATFEDLVEVVRHLRKDSKGLWYDRESGDRIYPPGQVFFGYNTMIAGNHLNDQIHALVVFLQKVLDYTEAVESED